ncbi:MAG: ArsA family ATPase [Deltaproteobacteria bacterium]|nr:ArsA family ATPase [Deltaproteobacteria bacterium]
MSRLLDKRLLFVTGKGGVGKSTITAALALKAARDGKRTLVCEVRSHERISALLGQPPVGPEIKRLEPNLDAVDIETSAAFREYALMKLKFQAVYKVVFENRLMKYALRAIPSIAEIVTLGKIVYHLGEKQNGRNRWDLILVDAPATGHALTLLRTPQTILDSVPAGAMADEMQHILDVFRDPKESGVVLVTLPEEMPVNETIELDRELARTVPLERSAVVLNGDLPFRFAPLELEAMQARRNDPALRPGIEAAEAYQRRSDLAAKYVEKLRAEVKQPLARVPFRFVRTFDRAVVESISYDLAVVA